MSLADLHIDPILFRMLYVQQWADEGHLDPGFADPELVNAITLIALVERSERQQIILARNLVHDHNCGSTTFRCSEGDRLNLARHRKMYRAQALRMLTTITQLIGDNDDAI